MFEPIEQLDCDMVLAFKGNENPRIEDSRR
jgi:hypothetical protein